MKKLVVFLSVIICISMAGKAWATLVPTINIDIPTDFNVSYVWDGEIPSDSDSLNFVNWNYLDISPLSVGLAPDFTCGGPEQPPCEDTLLRASFFYGEPDSMSGYFWSAEFYQNNEYGIIVDEHIYFEGVDLNFYFDRKVNSTESEIYITGTMVPVPSAILLISSGLLGIFGFKKKFYAVEDRTPRVYPWMNEPEGGTMNEWKSPKQLIVHIALNTT